MADTINADDYTRAELDKTATEAGLTDAAKYANKPAVADAINRVRGGEDAAAVNAELAPSGDSGSDPGSDTTDDQKPADSASKQSGGKKIKAVNGGHPTQFDETGNPVYDPSQV